MAYNIGATRIIGRLIGANFNVATDQTIAIDAAVYTIDKIIVTNASISLTTAAGGFYTGGAKSGTILVLAAQAYAALTTAVKVLNPTINSTDRQTATPIFLSLTTPQGAAATADVYVIGSVLTEK